MPCKQKAIKIVLFSSYISFLFLILVDEHFHKWFTLGPRRWIDSKISRQCWSNVDSLNAPVDRRRFQTGTREYNWHIGVVLPGRAMSCRYRESIKIVDEPVGFEHHVNVTRALWVKIVHTNRYSWVSGRFPRRSAALDTANETPGNFASSSATAASRASRSMFRTVVMFESK